MNDRSKLGPIPPENFDNETDPERVIDKREGSLFDRLKRKIGQLTEKEPSS
jgi:hypothetical protein